MGSVEAASPTAEAPAEVTPEVLRLWLRRAKRKYRHGVPVVKIESSGKPVRRTLFIGAKKEYFELISTTLFDVAYHMTEIEKVETGLESQEFRNYFATHAEESRAPKPDRSLVITTAGGNISIVFTSTSDRRDCEFLMRVERKGIADRYEAIAQEFENKQREAGIIS